MALRTGNMCAPKLWDRRTRSPGVRASAGTPEFDGGPIERSKSLFVAWITRRRIRREQDVRGHALLSCSEPSEVRLWALYGRPCEQTVETSGATGGRG